MNNTIVDRLREKGWMVEQYKEPLPTDEIKKKLREYNYLDLQYLMFLSKIKSCVNQRETIWFNCLDEIEGRSNIAFQWNEFECLSLEAADGDKAWEKEIRDFWSGHFPIVLSVEDGYSYHAINKKGEIVSGMEPEFEEVTVVANTFMDFLEGIVKGEFLL